MRKLAVASVLSAALVATPAALAGPDARPAPPPVIVDAAPAPAAVDAETPSSSTTTVTTVTTTPAGSPTLAQQLEDLQKAYAAYKSQSEATAKRLLFFGLLAVAFNILISVLKSIAGWTKGKKVKLWIPVVALGLGAATALLSSLAAGQTFLWSLIYGASPAFSVFIHELLNLVRAKPATAG